MSYDYVDFAGLKKSALRPAGQVAVYDHVITRLQELVPRVVTKYGGTDKDYHSVVDITYSFEFPEIILDLPFVAVTFISESSRDVGLGMDAAGSDINEFSGFTKNMILQIDVWGRNSMERDLVADAILDAIHRSRRYFNSLGFRDFSHRLGGTRMFEQTRDTIYPRVSQTTSKVWRKVLSFEVEYDLVFAPYKESSIGRIEEIDIDGYVWDAEYSFRVGQAMDLLLDSRYVLKDYLERFIW